MTGAFRKLARRRRGAAAEIRVRKANLALLLVGALALGIALFSLTIWSVRGGFGDDLIVSILANALFIPLGALLTVLYFTTWRDQRILRSYRQLAQARPEILLPGATETPFRIPRSSLARELLAELGAAPTGQMHVVSGPAGCGKTTMLQEIITRLAEIGYVPVPVRADRFPDLSNLEVSAQLAFLNAVDTALMSTAEGERAWRRAKTQRSVVIVVDGMDDWRARNGMSQIDALAALDYEANRLPHRIVVAIRSDDANFALEFPTFILPRLDLSVETLDRILDNYPLPIDPIDRQAWLTALTAADASRWPLFLTLSLGLLHVPKAFSGIDRMLEDRARLQVLDAWFEQRKRRLIDRHPQFLDELGNSIRVLAATAYCMSIEGRLDMAAPEIRAAMATNAVTIPNSMLSWRRMTGAYRAGLNLGLLQSDPAESVEGQQFQFRHSIYQVYLSTIHLRESPQDFAFSSISGSSEEYLRAVEFALLDDDRATIQREVKRGGLQLLERDALLDLAQLDVLTRAGDLTQSEQRHMLSAMADRFTNLNDDGKYQILGLAQKIRHFTPDLLYRQLWTWVPEGSFEVGDLAALILARGGGSSFRAVGVEVDALIKRNRGRWLYNVTDWRENGGTVTKLSLVVPTWRQYISNSSTISLVLDEWIETYLELVEIGQLGGIELSVVQGFASALDEFPNAPVWPALKRLSSSARSHYARTRLVQILARHGSRALGRSEALFQLRRFAAKREHPFVRTAAQRVLSAPASLMEEMLWRPGEQHEPKSGARLDPQVHQLLSDSYLLANLEDQGGGTDEELERRQNSWLSTELPWCLSRSTTRAELFSGCASQCAFDLCPLDLDAMVMRRLSPMSNVFMARAEDLT